jgi:hypothetical protein
MRHWIFGLHKSRKIVTRWATVRFSRSIWQCCYILTGDTSWIYLGYLPTAFPRRNGQNSGACSAGHWSKSWSPVRLDSGISTVLVTPTNTAVAPGRWQSADTFTNEEYADIHFLYGFRTESDSAAVFNTYTAAHVPQHLKQHTECWLLHTSECRTSKTLCTWCSGSSAAKPKHTQNLYDSWCSRDTVMELCARSVSGSVTCKRGQHIVPGGGANRATSARNSSRHSVHGDGIVSTRNWRPWAREIHTR